MNICTFLEELLLWLAWIPWHPCCAHVALQQSTSQVRLWLCVTVPHVSFIDFVSLIEIPLVLQIILGVVQAGKSWVAAVPTHKHFLQGYFYSKYHNLKDIIIVYIINKCEAIYMCMSSIHLCLLRFSSQIGRVMKERFQFIEVERACDSSRKKELLENILLALGKSYEHLRDDRDMHVRINWRNIHPGEPCSVCINTYLHDNRTLYRYN